MQLTDDLFDAIEFDAASRGDHLTAALRMSRLAGTADQDGGMSRAEAYLRAGEQWLLADDPAEAAGAFRQAIADGGDTFVDPRAPLARALYLLGDSDQAATLVGQLKAEGPRDPRVCDLVGELLLEQSDLPGALGWVTAGVELCLPGGATSPPPPALGDDVSTELRLLLNLRYRIRNDLGLPEDSYDRLLDELDPADGTIS
ncbi:MAG TPA: tetratricopeptide repeat protein [Streptosporangiaceae bacterium]|nr:tetratricopeptide repeat protein [Streptosporangiaceae bacterium]